MTIDLNNMTPELKAAIAEQLIANTFSSKSVHAIGDKLAKAAVVLASATQKTTDVAAHWGGTVEVIAVPTAIKAVATARAFVMGLSGRAAIGLIAGCKAATAPKSNFTGFSF